MLKVLCSEVTVGVLLCAPFYRLQRFTADFRDLTSWVTEMKALINADELANDVAGAEALLDRHQEHKVTCLLLENLYYDQNRPSLLCLINDC